MDTQSLMWLPIVFYLGVAVIGVVSFIWGRLFCGWVCPHNTLTEWTRAFRAVFGRDAYPRWMQALFKKAPALKVMFNLSSLPLAVVITAVLSVVLSTYIVPLDWILAQYGGFKPHVALVFGHFLFVLIGMFLLYAGHDFCRNACPYGMAQSMSAYQEGRWQPMEIEYAPLASIEDDCNTCTGCQTACPVDLDPRYPENLKVGEFFGCFNCGECIDACKQVHDYREMPGLLRFKSSGESLKEFKESKRDKEKTAG